jgi:DNA-binding MarR family transcriptional regulator
MACQTLIEISHAEALGPELPAQWCTFWQHILSRQAAAVYLTLRENDGAEMDMDRWAEHLKMSRTWLMKALRELEDQDFVSLGNKD